jgi:hypothetical protein
MPRSQKKRISDMLDLIETDEMLQYRFAKLLLSVIEHDLQLKDKLADGVSRELANRMRGYGL